LANLLDLSDAWWRPLSRGSSPASYPAKPLVSYQIDRQLSGLNLPPQVIRAFGAHGQVLIHPITILSTLPSAGVGALLALMALQFDFSLIAMIGTILLIGIVKKNAIMMIDFALVGERNRNLHPEERSTRPASSVIGRS
jgi:hypothetical protein